MFPYVNTLPRAEGKFAGLNGNAHARIGQHRSKVRRHVIWPFGIVRKNALLIRGESVHPVFQIYFGARICILKDDKACAGVLNKHIHKPISQAVLGDDVLNLGGNVIEPACSGGNGNGRGHLEG